MLIDFMRSYPWRGAIMFACLLFASLFEGVGIATLFPLLNIIGGTDLHATQFGKVTEEVLDVLGMEPSLGILLSLIFIGIMLKSCFTLLAMRQVGYTVAYVVTDLRLSLISALLKARWDYFLRQPVGTFTNAISTEAIRLSKGYQQACSIMAGSIQVIFYLIIALLISWQVTVVSL